MSVKKAKVRPSIGLFVANVFFSIVKTTNGVGKHLLSEEDIRDRYTNLHSRFVEVAGQEIHYRIEGNGPTLLLLHGFGASLHAWDAWVRILKKKYRIVRIDLPGFGLSSQIKSGMQVDVDFYMNVVSGLLDKFEIEDCYLAGNSFGGWVSWEFTARHPERVKKLVLINSAGFDVEANKPQGVRLISGPAFQKILRCGVPKIIVRNVVKKSYGKIKKASEDTIERYYRISNREGNIASLIRIATTEAVSNPKRLREIKSPTLILWGDHDKILPLNFAERFHTEIPNSRLIMYPKVGHIPMVELPKLSAADVDHFFNK